MRGIGIVTMMQLGREARERRRPLRHGAPDGTYACLARHVHYWSGARAGEDEALEGSAWELDIITDQSLLWERRGGETVHDGMPVEISYRPGGVDQLVARNGDGSFVLRIALGPLSEQIPMPFTALGTNIVVSGICHFEPRIA